LKSAHGETRRELGKTEYFGAEAEKSKSHMQRNLWIQSKGAELCVTYLGACQSLSIRVGESWEQGTVIRDVTGSLNFVWLLWELNLGSCCETPK